MSNPIADLASYLLPIVFGAFMAIVLLRFLMQYLRLSFSNPLGQFIIQASNPLILPLRKFLPSIGAMDTASLVLAFLTHVAFVLVLAFFSRLEINLVQTILWSIVGVVMMMLGIFTISIFASIIASWVPDLRHQPIVRTALQIAQPVMEPFRRMMPDMGGIDLSPMIPLILIQCVKIFLSSMPILYSSYILGF